MSAYRDVEASAVTNSNAAVCEGGFSAMIDYIWYSSKTLSSQNRLLLPSDDELRIRSTVSTSSVEVVPTLLSAGWPSDHLCLAVDLKLNDL